VEGFLNFISISVIPAKALPYSGIDMAMIKEGLGKLKIFLES